MSVTGRRRFPSIIEQVVASKPKIKKITADTFRNDAAAILESLVAEFKEDDVVGAMNQQGFKGEAYRQTIKSLAAVAKQRRLLRRAIGGNRQDIDPTSA